MENKILFKNRSEAGKNLAEKLINLNLNNENIIVFGLPRGGVPVAYEVAKKLNAELQVLPIRKISLPPRQEVALGAISFDGSVTLNEKHIEMLGVSVEKLKEEVRSERIRINEMLTKFRKNQDFPDLEGKIAIVVDDGIATGYTAKVALKTLRKYNPKQLILATPIIDVDVYNQLSNYADSILGNTTNDLRAISMFYENFGQVSDEEVLGFLNK